MRAVWITRWGGPEVLEVREAPDPEPKDGEVRIRVAATGLNFADIMARMGLYPDGPKAPCVVGYEVAGTVDAVGKGVTDLAEGDEVSSLTRFGGHADVVCAPQVNVRKRAEGMTAEQGAAIPVNYLTAYFMIHRMGSLHPGDAVLIHMAAGGVGLAAIELCKLVDGVTIFGTASPGKHDFIRERGCHHPIDYRSKDYAEEVRRITDGKGVRLVLDPLGGKDWKKGYDLLRAGGRLMSFGFANMVGGERRSIIRALRQFLSVPKFSPIALMNDNRQVGGVNLGHLWDEPEMVGEMLEELARLFSAGKIAPHVDKTFPLEQAAEAHRYIQERKNIGKVLLTT